MAKETTFEDPPGGHVAELGYDSANDRWQAAHVDANGLKQVDIADVADRQVNAHGYDGATWRKLALLWGYSDRVVEAVLDENADAGLNTLTTTAVPEGSVYVIQAIGARDRTTAITNIIILATGNGNGVPLRYDGSPVANGWTVWDGEITLKEDDYIQANFNGCVAGDDLDLRIWGYEMLVTQ